jgi:hypothetical protein
MRVTHIRLTASGGSPTVREGMSVRSTSPLTVGLPPLASFRSLRTHRL